MVRSHLAENAGRVSIGMAKHLDLRIRSPEGLVFTGQVVAVRFSCHDGDRAVFPWRVFPFAVVAVGHVARQHRAVSGGLSRAVARCAAALLRSCVTGCVAQQFGAVPCTWHAVEKSNSVTSSDGRSGCSALGSSTCSWRLSPTRFWGCRSLVVRSCARGRDSGALSRKASEPFHARCLVRRRGRVVAVHPRLESGRSEARLLLQAYHLNDPQSR